MTTYLRSGRAILVGASLLTPHLAPAAAPRINEFTFNHAGSDVSEFIEVLGDASSDLSSLAVIVIEGDGAGAGTIDRAYPLGVTDASGYWRTDFLANQLENGTQTALLVEGFTGSIGDDVDTDDDGTLDITPWASLVDAVAVADGGAGDRTYATTVLDPGFDFGSFTVGGASRIPDGVDTDSPFDWVRNDFDGDGLPGFPSGGAEPGEAVNTPGAMNEVAGGPPTPTADVVINEIDADTPGVDSAEFVELYDGGSGETGLDGLALVFFNGATDASYRVFDLDGLATDADGYFVVGNASVGPDVVLAENGLQNGADAVALYVADGADFPNGTPPTTADLVDALVYGTGDPDDAGLLSALGETTQHDETSTSSIGRIPNGTGDFQTLSSPSPRAGNDAAPPTTSAAIYEIQGAGHRSPLAGRRVSTTGLVTAVDGNGFYAQDALGDGNLATSDGIFVFTGSSPPVAVGDLVQVSGAVEERQFPPDLSTTQLTGVFDLVVLGSGNPLPGAVVLGADGRTPPTETIDDDGLSSYDPAADGIDFYESLEGMLVTVADAVAVSPTNRFREIWTLADGGALATGRNARGGITIGADDFNPERIQIQIDDTLTPGDAPAVDVGDRLGDVTGVVAYSFGNFEILATQFLAPVGGGLQPEETELPRRRGRLSIASFNVLNLDPDDTDGDADVDGGRFAAVAGQIVENLGAPDIVALQEIQDNSGAIDDGTVDAGLTYETLVDAVVLAGGPRYEFFDLPPEDGADGGQPGANIRVGFLYDPETVGLDASSVARLVDPDPSDGDAFFESRKPLSATFVFDGRELHVVNVHFSSKGGSSPLFGEIQPPVNGGEDQRVAQAMVVNDHVDAVLGADPNARVVVLGDFNEFDFLPPLDVVKGGGEPVLRNLAEELDPNERYSFNFEGNAQQLDHILVSDGLAEAELDVVHANSEFSTQASDHDPIVARLFAQRVALDIKPGSERNCVNNDGHGVIPVAVLGSDGSGDFAPLDVGAVDVASLSLEGLTVARLAGKWLLAHRFDLNRDGLDDLLALFADRAGAFTPEATTARITGRLLDGTPIEGADRICLVGSKKDARD